MQNPIDERSYLMNRRAFLAKTSVGIGTAALASILGTGLTGCSNQFPEEMVKASVNGMLKNPHFAPKAKRVIYLFQSGGPSQLELFDYKPLLTKMRGQDLPESIRQGQRLTGMTSGQESFPLADSLFKF
ncbi:MAG: DUF1501 domain-containing protein, partial [Bacteroidetes bacterium]